MQRFLSLAFDFTSVWPDPVALETLATGASEGKELVLAVGHRVARAARALVLLYASARAGAVAGETLMTGAAEARRFIGAGGIRVTRDVDGALVDVCGKKAKNGFFFILKISFS